MRILTHLFFSAIFCEKDSICHWNLSIKINVFLLKSKNLRKRINLYFDHFCASYLSNNNNTIYLVLLIIFYDTKNQTIPSCLQILLLNKCVTRLQILNKNIFHTCSTLFVINKNDQIDVIRLKDTLSIWLYRWRSYIQGT